MNASLHLPGVSSGRMRPSWWRKVRLWFRSLRSDEMASTIGVSLRSDGIIEVDILDSTDDEWNCDALTIEEAKFLHEELGEVLQRAAKRFPNGTPPPKEEEDDSEDDVCPNCLK